MINYPLLYYQISKKYNAPHKMSSFLKIFFLGVHINSIYGFDYVQVGHLLPSNHGALAQCWADVGSAS